MLVFVVVRYADHGLNTENNESIKIKEIADKLSKVNFKKKTHWKYEYKTLQTDTAHVILTNFPQCHNM